MRISMIFNLLLLSMLLSACGNSSSVIEQSKAVIEQSKIAEENMEQVRQERRRLAEEKQELETLRETEINSQAVETPLYNENLTEFAEAKGRIISSRYNDSIDKDSKNIIWFSLYDETFDLSLLNSLGDLEMAFASIGMRVIGPVPRDITVEPGEISTVYYTNDFGDEIKLWARNLGKESINFRYCNIVKLQIIYNNLDGTDRPLDNFKYLGQINRLMSGSDCLRVPAILGLADDYAQDGAGFSISNKDCKVTLMGKGPYGFFWGTSDANNTLGSITIEFLSEFSFPVENSELSDEIITSEEEERHEVEQNS